MFNWGIRKELNKNIAEAILFQDDFIESHPTIVGVNFRLPMVHLNTREI